MKRKIFKLTVPMIFIAGMATAQTDSIKNKEKVEAYLGLGVGLDYGGIGLRLEVHPLPFISLFGGAGYNLDKAAFNVGTSIKFLPKKPVTPTLQLMYGYNAVSNRSKTYYGPSVGAGVDMKFGKRPNKLFASVNYPFKSDAFKKENYGVFPLAFTIGYNFNLNP